jgi:hypothetical protein
MEGAGVVASGIVVGIETSVDAGIGTDVDIGVAVGADAVNSAAQAVNRNKKRTVVRLFILILWNGLRFN